MSPQPSRKKFRGRDPMPLEDKPAPRVVVRVWLDRTHLVKLDRAEQERMLAGDRTVNRSTVIRDLIDEKWPTVGGLPS